jgi:KDO2-lipid IV(A) lauroyltransferase
MRARKESLWKRLQWRLEWLAHTIVECLVALIPGPLVFRLGEILGDLAWRMMPRRRKTVTRNLRIAFAGSKTPEELEKLVRETFRRTGGNLVSVTHTARLSKNRLSKIVELKGTEHISAALAAGRGVVVIIPHMGNWEVLSRLHIFLPEKPRSGAFYRPLNNPLMNERILKRRGADGTRLFSKRDSFLPMVKFLRENQIMGILADQRVGKQGDLVSFFGRLTRCTPLPSLLARRAKCPMVALSMVTVRPGKWEARFTPVERPYTTESSMIALEEAMKVSPADAFWFHERWKPHLRRFFPLSRWFGDNTARGKTPHRALIWLADAPESWQPPEEWLHPDVIYEVAQTSSAPRPSWLPDSARVHRIVKNADRATLQNHLAEIDALDELPLDFILMPNSQKDLMEAARRESVPVIALQ